MIYLMSRDRFTACVPYRWPIPIRDRAVVTKRPLFRPLPHKEFYVERHHFVVRLHQLAEQPPRCVKPVPTTKPVNGVHARLAGPMFSRPRRSGGDDHRTPQIIVLPPHRDLTRLARRGPPRPHPALQETVIEDDAVWYHRRRQQEGQPRAFGPNSGRAMSLPAQPRQAFVSSPRNGRPNSARPAESAVRAQRHARAHSLPADERHDQLPQQLRRPASVGKRRPGSRPATATDSAGGRPDVSAMWTPGEAVLTGPSLTPLSATVGSHSARRPASEELQYELSVTASVLRAAQTRLTKEREQRQLARVGEELALVDAKRTKDERKALGGAQERGKCPSQGDGDVGGEVAAAATAQGGGEPADETEAWSGWCL